jgi:hypothetical protein
VRWRGIAGRLRAVEDVLHAVGYVCTLLVFLWSCRSLGRMMEKSDDEG